MEPDNPEKRELFFKKLAEQKQENKSQLEMTAEDHARASGTLPPNLANLAANPGVPRAQLLSDPEIFEYLKDRERGIAESSLPGLTAELRRDLNSSIAYLRKIGRLPPKYQAKAK